MVRHDPVLHELDGIARLRDITHLIMATTSRKLDKAKADVKKLESAAQKEHRRGVPVEKWLVTEHQLEAEHVEFARKHNVKALTLDQFRHRFFDGRAYMTKRKKSAFGSARNLQSGSISIPEDEYVELPMNVLEVSNVPRRAGVVERAIDLQGLSDLLDNGHTVVLVGPLELARALPPESCSSG